MADKVTNIKEAAEKPKAKRSAPGPRDVYVVYEQDEDGNVKNVRALTDAKEAITLTKQEGVNVEAVTLETKKRA